MYSPGSEILAYLQSVADKYQIMPYIKFRHELIGARYDEPAGRWHIQIKRPSQTTSGAFEEVEDWADFVFSGIGVLHRWQWPDIAGLKDFKGVVVHSADWKLGGTTWEEDVQSWGDKNVAVIGLVCVLPPFQIECTPDNFLVPH